MVLWLLSILLCELTAGEKGLFGSESKAIKRGKANKKMARIKLTDIISDIRGKVGTHVYSIWKNIHLVKMQPVNFPYPWQSAYNWPMRKLIDLCTYRWKRILSDAQKEGWESYAIYLGDLAGLYAEGAVDTIPGLRGYAGVMSGFNAFTMTNALRRSVGYADFLDDDPEGEYFPPQPELLTFGYAYGPPAVLDVTLTPLAPQALDFWLVAWCRGKSLAHLLMAKILRGENVGATNWNKLHYARGLEYDILPDDYQVQLIYITEKGTFSPWSNYKQMKFPPGFKTKKWDAWMWDGYIWN